MKVCLHKFAEPDDFSKYQKCKMCGKYFRPNKIRTIVASVVGILILGFSSYFLEELTKGWNDFLGLFIYLGFLCLIGYTLVRVLPTVFRIYQEKR